MARPEKTAGDQARPRRRERSVGRLAGLAVFWIGTLYLMAVGFWSLTPPIFFPTSDAPAPASCVDALRTLKAELSARHAARAAGGAASAADTRRWLDDWDARYVAAGPACEGAGATPHADLGRLRVRVETSIERIEREQYPLTRRIDHALETLASRER